MTDAIERLRSCLLALERDPGGPRLDIEWLRLRCDDTLTRYSGELQRASARQLQKDVSRFVEQFPGLLPKPLIDELRAINV